MSRTTVSASKSRTSNILVLLCGVLLLTNIQSTHSQNTTNATNVTSLTNATEAAIPLGWFYPDTNVSVGQSIRIIADGFTTDPSDPAILYTVHIFAPPSEYYPDKTRVVLYFQVKSGGVMIMSNYRSVYHNDYLADKDMFLSTNPDEPIRLEFKLTATKWEFYYQGNRMPEYDWKHVLIGAIPRVVAQWLVNPVISIEDTAGIDYSVEINTAEFIATTLIFIIASIAANAVIIFFFYWKHRSEPALEAPSFTPYLQEIVVPLSLLIEDMCALAFEDEFKSMNLNITTIVIIQFVCLMTLSWCRECLSFSVPTKRIGSLLAIIMEYVFAILFISLSKSQALAGFVIGILTIIQIVSEIMAVIYTKHTDSCFCIPSVFRIFAPQSLDTSLSDKERLVAIAVGCASDKGARTLLLVIVFHIIYFAAGCVYIETDECYGDWFKYWWVFGMFLFSKVLESKFDSTDVESWEKTLMSSYLAVLELFIVITTIVTWPRGSDSEECDEMPLFVYAGMVMIVWILLFGGVFIYLKVQRACL